MASRDDKENNQGSWSKKRKQQENMKDSSPRHGKKFPKVDWKQDGEDLTMSMRLDGLKAEQLQNIDIQFNDTDVTIKLVDGRQWTWRFSEEIIRDQSRVQVKKQRLTLHMKKKVAKDWDYFESVPVTKCPTPEITENVKQDSEAGGKLEGMEPGSVAPAPSPCDLDLTVQADTNKTDNWEEKITKEEEPIHLLSHVKHDYIEKDDTFHVHLYVREVNKDAVRIHFYQQRFIVKFQTSDARFLKLHEDTTVETVFCWDINLKGEVIPDKCKHKLTPSMIELTLVKKEFGRWKDLEALQRKAPEIQAKTKTDWISVSEVKARDSTSVSTPGSTPLLGEKSVHKGKKTKTEDTESDDSSEKLTSRGSTAYTASNKENLGQQKPTCKVQPLNKNTELSEQVVSPGFTGLDNLGNTCFMNGVLQCLVNTRELRDYFLDSNLKDDLNMDNPLGSGGRLALAFAVLMKILWSGKHYSYATSKLKSLVAQKASQFTGFAQHDSQEFMAFLLDGLHEDLNRIKKKPYTETVEDAGRPDEVVAAEAWAVHKKRNDSFIVDLFQGQYKSKLVCPVCGKVSITFDPFLYLSLPLPKRQRLLPVTFMWKDPYRKPVRYMLRLSKDATVEALKDSLQKKTGVNPQHIRVFEAYKGKINKIFGRGSDLSSVQASDILIANEVLSEEVAGEAVCEIAVIQRTLMPNQFPSRCASCRKLCPEGSKLRRCAKCFKAGYCDNTCQKSHWPMHRTNCKQTPEPVGCPFILSIPESRATFSRMCQLMEAYARYSVDVFQPPVKTDCSTKLSSQPSSSSLSTTSSQSSGSLNSLDSQSSFSSSCTITADQEQNLDDVEPDGAESTSVTTLNAGGSDSGISTEQSSSSVGSVACCSTSGDFAAPESSSPGAGQDEVDGTKDIQGNKKGVDIRVGTVGPAEEKSTTASTGEKSVESSPIVNPVLGIQSSDSERSMPMFHIKPVNQEGYGLTGADGERLEDKGEIALDLTNKFFLSIDWKNNDKLPCYVLVQSKELEFETDSSMMTASLEENSNVTLDQCLELFTEPEILSPEEAWYCPQCKEHREAFKQLSTWKLPHTLIIQLKRFSFRNFIWRDKIDKMVEYPIRGLDLSHYYVGSRPSTEPPPVYDLYGVVNHHGGILGGHYTAYVRCADASDPNRNEVGWRLCDDSRVSSISHEKNVVTRAAYLLFYRRREVFIPQPSAGLSTKQSELEQKTAAQSVDHKTREEIPNSSQDKEDELPDLEIDAGDQNVSSNFSGTQLDTNISSHVLEYTDMDSVD